MFDPDKILIEKVEGRHHKLFVNNGPHGVGGWIPGEIGVCWRKDDISPDAPSRVLITARNHHDGKAVNIAFTPEQALAFAAGVVRKVNELKENE